MLDLENIHIKADAYGGDVTIRSYAYLRVSTALQFLDFEGIAVDGAFGMGQG